MNKLLC